MVRRLRQTVFVGGARLFWLTRAGIAVHTRFNLLGYFLVVAATEFLGGLAERLSQNQRGFIYRLYAYAWSRVSIPGWLAAVCLLMRTSPATASW